MCCRSRRKLTQVVQRPLGAKADLTFEVILVSDPSLQLLERMLGHRFELLVYRDFVFTYFRRREDEDMRTRGG